jgi:hypothetical protein
VLARKKTETVVGHLWGMLCTNVLQISYSQYLFVSDCIRQQMPAHRIEKDEPWTVVNAGGWWRWSEGAQSHLVAVLACCIQNRRNFRIWSKLNLPDAALRWLHRHFWPASAQARRASFDPSHASGMVLVQQVKSNSFYRHQTKKTINFDLA